MGAIVRRGLAMLLAPALVTPFQGCQRSATAEPSVQADWVQEGGPNPSGGEPGLSAAFELMVQGNFEEARPLMSAQWDREQTPLVTFCLAVCHDRLGAHQEAMLHYNSVLEDPALGPPAQARMTLLNSAGSTPSDEARREAQQQFVQGSEQFQQGNHQEAIQSFLGSYAAVPHARTLYNIAFCYQTMGEVLPALGYHFIVAHDPSVDEETQRESVLALEQLADQHLRRDQ